MPLILSGNVASATADAGYTVANSCRLNPGAKLTKTFGSTSNRRTYTVSLWLKKCSTTTEQNFVFAGDVAGANPYFDARFDDTQIINWYHSDGSGNEEFNLKTNAVFRDPSAWYHIVFAVDTTQGTDTNRLKLYVNGEQISSFSRSVYPDQNFDTAFNVNDYESIFGALRSNTPTYDGYMAEVVMIDGSQLTPTSFGEFDEDSPNIWKPIDVSGLTFGTHGFYLDFEASDNLGNDANGGTDFTETDLAATDQATDTPTNNFCTWNALDTYYSSATFAEGNTTVVTPNGSITYATGTIGLSSGRWYFEVQPYDPSDDNNIGIVDHVSTSNSSSAGELQYQPRGWCYRQAGDAYNNNSSLTGSWSSYSAGVTIGVFLDLEDNTIYWSRDGVMQNSGTGISITAAASTDTGFYFPAVGDYNGSDDTTFLTNFGGSSSFAISSAVTDDNGYGNFEYTPSVTVDSTAKKFYAICTKNLAEYG